MLSVDTPFLTAFKTWTRLMVLKDTQGKGSISSARRESQISTSYPFLDQNNLDQNILDLETLSFKNGFEIKFLRCPDARILLNVALFGKQSEDKVEMNEGEMNSFEKSFKTPCLGVWSWRKEERREENKVGRSSAWIRVGPNLCGFTETCITFSTGGILMQGLRHWKANFRGFNLDTNRPFFDLTGHPPALYLSGRQFIVPTGTLFCWPAIFASRRPSGAFCRLSRFQLCQLECTELIPHAHVCLFCTLWAFEPPILLVAWTFWPSFLEKLGQLF